MAKDSYEKLGYHLKKALLERKLKPLSEKEKDKLLTERDSPERLKILKELEESKSKVNELEIKLLSTRPHLEGATYPHNACGMFAGILYYPNGEQDEYSGRNNSTFYCLYCEKDYDYIF